MFFYFSNDSIAEDVKAGSFYTTPNGFNTNFSFFREDIAGYHSTYKLKDISSEMIKTIVKDGGYNPDETDTPGFQTNLSDLTPCNRFITSLYDKERFLYLLKYGLMYITEIKRVHNATTNKDEEIPVKQKHVMRYPHEWQSVIADRNKGSGYPYCSTKKILKGYNDSLTTNPILAKEWNYEKNNDFHPDMVTAGSEKRLWWKCKKGHEWIACIKTRNRGSRCPICSKEKRNKILN